VIGALLSAAAGSACSAGRYTSGTERCAALPCQKEVVLTGMFHVVWNGEARYFLVTTDGPPHELQIDEEVAREHGGRLALDRRRVTVTGTSMTERRLRVLAVRVEPRSGAIR
jgi:hypothetical protein